MHDDIILLLNDKKYSDAKDLIVNKLKNDDNPNLWYLLFLAENGNYLDFDPNNINNSFAYNKSSLSENEDYEMEFRLYKELSYFGLNKLFRLIQIGRYDEADEILIRNKKFEFNLSKIATSYLNEIITSCDDDIKSNFYLRFVEYIYECSNNKQTKKIKDKFYGYFKETGIKELNNLIDYKDTPIWYFDIQNGILLKYYGKIDKVTIPNIVEEIASSVFAGNEELKEIVIPDSVLKIGDSAFKNCNNLENIVLSKDLTSIGKEAFNGCCGLSYFNIPDGVTSIGESAFAYCTNLKEITIPSNLKKIENNTFLACSNINKVKMSDNIIKIGDYAFSDCVKLTEINISNKLKEIGQYAFSNCSNLKEIIFSSNLNRIGINIFKDCKKLKEVYCLKNNIRILKDNTANKVNVIEYGESPDFEIKNGVLLNYKGSSSDVKIPVYIREIGDKAFADCKRLNSVIIPESVKVIGDYAFYNCTKLQMVKMPLSLELIGDYAFYNCINLTSILIPNKIKEIKSFTFYGCYRLVELYNLSSINITIKSNDNGFIANNALVINNSSNVSSIITTTKDGFVFANTNGFYKLIGYNGNKSEVILPDSINGSNYGINAYAFTGCEFNSITFPTILSSVDYCIFNNCQKLNMIYCNVNVKNLLKKVLPPKIFDYISIT